MSLNCQFFVFHLQIWWHRCAWSLGHDCSTIMCSLSPKGNITLPLYFPKMMLLTRPSDAVRLAPEEASVKLTGYEHNGVTCIGMRTDIPVINHLCLL